MPMSEHDQPTFVIKIETKPRATLIGLGLLCLTRLSTMYQVYWWRKLEYTDKPINPPQVTGKLYHNFSLIKM